MKEVKEISYLTFFKGIGFIPTVILLNSLIFYKLKHIEGKGWHLVKRRWLWWLLSPVFIPCVLVFKIAKDVILVGFEYFSFVNNYWSSWIESEKELLSIRERISNHYRLLN